ncbi:hypothetical protein DSAG12_02538 [Promethearchaeum syntrophicum]|uniref:Uncharacterized protein n=1 Tax=Promethearchaeum syntrophicum TaxID=2594042 RepID=A0A5B9DBY4_9ARCH|nr:hypothetical protein [Candidatus Prometheoarchaeum syntrophicum]QEE16708.1 hypothetical protein DSAG12_02538 [Candidatus Prometheoarchaeum syntrophicum]
MATAEAVKTTQLLENLYGEYYRPLNWEYGKKSRNFFAKIKKGRKSLFERVFLKSYTIDDQVCFKKSDFLEGEIIEQKSVFIKGTKQEATFHGFFIIHNNNKGIYGEIISQKDTLEYFECKEKFPEIEESVKNKLRLKLGDVIRKLTLKYGDQLIVEVLADIMEDYFPDA